MTIPSYDNRRSYAGDGSTTVFAFPPPFTTNTDLVVAIKDASGNYTTKILATDYTVTGAGNPAGGNVTMLVAPATGTTLIVLRKVPPTQAMDLQDGGPLPSPTINRAHDRRAMVEQYILDMMMRSLTKGELDDGTGPFNAGGSQIIGAADAVVGSGLVTLSQLVIALSTGIVGPAGSVTKRQVVLALTDSANPAGANMLPNVNAYADPMAADAGSAQWFAGSAMAPSDALYTLIQTATGWSSPQMDAFMTLARSKPV
jgi:hypothetical protein